MRAAQPGFGFLALLLLAGGCRYGEPRAGASSPPDDGCQSHCADVHLGCVRNGIAARLGLPGVTYDLCARELDDCRAGCHDFTAQLPAEGATDGGAAFGLNEGVGWEDGGKVLRCPGGAPVLHLPPALAGAVERVAPGEVQVRLLPDAVVTMRAGRGEAAPLLEDWAQLQAVLTALPADASVEFKGSAAASGAWKFEYTLADGAKAAAFRAAQHTVRRAGGYCRVLGIERADAAPGRGVVQLVEGFGPASPPGP